MRSSDSSPAGRFNVTSPAVVVVYASALFQGLALVSFPALSTVLTRGYGLTDAQYGAIFLPQVACAVLGAILGGGLAHRVGLKKMLALSLASAAVSQACLAALIVLPDSLAFPAVLASTAALGFGFGVSGAPINSYPPTFFPSRSHTAVVAAHSLVGLGLAIGPLVAGQFVAGGMWAGFPLLLVVLGVVLTAVTLAVPLPECEPKPMIDASAPASRPLTSSMFWIFVAITVLYAFAEGTFSNWAVIYLRDARGLPEMTASLSLSAFWGALVVGRLVVSALVTRIAPAVVWAALPLLMIASFVLLPSASSAASGIALFALAGLGCSAFLPLSITLASHRFPEDVAWVSSMLIAALMVGVGVGSFAIGALRDVLSFESLYRLSILYPIAVLVLAIPVLRASRQPALAH
jgi:fucose permease